MYMDYLFNLMQYKLCNFNEVKLKIVIIIIFIWLL